MENKESNELDFDKEYEKLQEKYNIPSFESLAEDFDVEKIFEKESTFVIREIRRAINEKLSTYLHFLENLINPNSSPMFVYSVIRNLSTDDKSKIKKMYEKLSSYQIEIMKLDTIYNEENEAKFVKETYNVWQELKTEIYDIILQLEKSSKEGMKSKERGYFG